MAEINFWKVPLNNRPARGISSEEARFFTFGMDNAELVSIEMSLPGHMDYFE